MSKRPSNSVLDTVAKHIRLDEHDNPAEGLPHSTPSSASEAAELLTTVLNNDIIRRNLTSCLDTKDYLALMGTSKTVRNPLYADRFDVDRCLKRFVSDPLAWRAAMKRSGSLITGSFVLQVLEGTQLLDGARWDDASLDIVSPGLLTNGNVVQSVFPVKLILGDGYSCAERRRCGERGGMITRYEKTDGRGKTLVIRHIHTFMGSAAACVLRHSRITATLNMMSWNKIYSLFPHQTFAGNKSYMLVPRGNIAMAKYTWKYIERGWKAENIVSPRVQYRELGLMMHTDSMTGEESALPPSLVNIRRIGDRRCCTIQLNIDGLQSATAAYTPDSVMELSEFALDIIQAGVLDNHFRIHVDEFTHPLLKHTYLISGKEGSLWERLVDWLAEWLPIQVMAKVDYQAEEWAALGMVMNRQGRVVYDALRRQPMDGYKYRFMDDWTLFDEDMLSRYVECEKSCQDIGSKDMIKCVESGLA